MSGWGSLSAVAGRPIEKSLFPPDLLAPKEAVWLWDTTSQGMFNDDFVEIVWWGIFYQQWEEPRKWLKKLVIIPSKNLFSRPLHPQVFGGKSADGIFVCDPQSWAMMNGISFRSFEIVWWISLSMVGGGCSPADFGDVRPQSRAVMTTTLQNCLVVIVIDGWGEEVWIDAPKSLFPTCICTHICDLHPRAIVWIVIKSGRGGGGVNRSGLQNLFSRPVCPQLLVKRELL